MKALSIIMLCDHSKRLCLVDCTLVGNLLNCGFIYAHQIKEKWITLYDEQSNEVFKVELPDYMLEVANGIQFKEILKVSNDD